MSAYDPQSQPPAYEPGRGAAFAVYGLYLLSIPSFAVFALVGVALAYVSRDGAGPLARSHLEDQIRVWWVAFMWGVGIAVLALIGWLLTVVLVGFPILWIAGVIGFIVMLWFTIKSLLGLLALIDMRPR
ncbi:MAG: hypothetical protein R3C16_13790 [Hyphomonadaceae bacterium]